MLLEAERDLARRDPLVPGLATVLDADALLHLAAAAFPGVRRWSAEKRYVRYTPGQRCTVAYSFETPSGPVPGYAVAYGPKAWRRVPATAGSLPGRPDGSPGGAVLLRERRITLCLFPTDLVLGALQELITIDLGRVLPDLGRSGRPCLSTLSYKPERRYVGAVDVGGEVRAVIKLHRPKAYRKALQAVVAIKSGSGLRVARQIAESPAHCAQVFECLPGRSLAHIISEPGFDPGVAATVGAALAALHRQSGRGLIFSSHRHQAEAVLRSAGELATLRPDLSDAVYALARRVIAGLDVHAPARRPIHGDFYAGQVLVEEDDIGVIDWDQAVRGDPEVDLGTFSAYLDAAQLRGKLDGGMAEALKEELLLGYESASSRGCRPDLVRAYATARLLQLALRPFRKAERHWPGRIAEIVERAENLFG